MSIPTTLQIPGMHYPPPSLTEPKDSSPPDKLFQPPTNQRGYKPKRPISARVIKARKPIRPGSAGKKSSRFVSIRDSNDTFISRVKSRKIPMDKERLHEEALALKIEMHKVQQENVKLRTHVKQLEREIVKRDDFLDSIRITNPTQGANLGRMHVILGYKAQIKELREQMRLKQQELDMLNRSLKSSKMGEMELEVQAYIDECTRLRRHLEEAIKYREETYPTPPQEPNSEYEQKIKSLQEQNVQLMMQIQQMQSNMFQGHQKKSKKKKGKGDSIAFQQEIMKLKAQMAQQAEEMNLREKRLKTELQQKNAQIEEKERIIQNFQSQTSGNTFKFTEADDTMQKNELSGEVELVFEKAKVRPGSANYRGRTEAKEENDDLQPVVKINQVLDYLTHTCYRFQLHRVPKQNILDVLFVDQDLAKKFTPDDLYRSFQNPPLQFQPSEKLKLFCRFLCEPPKLVSISKQQLASLSAYPKDIIFKLANNIDDWDIFTLDVEKQLDQQLTNIIQKNHENITKKCQEYDRKQDGYITLTQLTKIFIQLKIQITDKVWKYMQLLFYSHQQQLDSVPYAQFIEAYLNIDQGPTEESIDPEEAYQIVIDSMKKIGQALQFSNKKVKQVFQADHRGLIYAEKFSSGLSTLGIDIPNDHLAIVMSSLQYEDEENLLCVHIGELEQVLQKFIEEGKVQHKVKLSSSSSSSKSKRSVKSDLLRNKGNFSESGSEYLSPDPQRDALRISNPSPFGSLVPDQTQNSHREPVVIDQKDISRDSSSFNPDSDQPFDIYSDQQDKLEIVSNISSAKNNQEGSQSAYRNRSDSDLNYSETNEGFYKSEQKAVKEEQKETLREQIYVLPEQQGKVKDESSSSSSSKSNRFSSKKSSSNSSSHQTSKKASSPVKIDNESRDSSESQSDSIRYNSSKGGSPVKIDNISRNSYESQNDSISHNSSKGDLSPDKPKYQSNYIHSPSNTQNAVLSSFSNLGKKQNSALSDRNLEQASEYSQDNQDSYRTPSHKSKSSKSSNSIYNRQSDEKKPVEPPKQAQDWEVDQQQAQYAAPPSYKKQLSIQKSESSDSSRQSSRQNQRNLSESSEDQPYSEISNKIPQKSSSSSSQSYSRSKKSSPSRSDKNQTSFDQYSDEYVSEEEASAKQSSSSDSFEKHYSQNASQNKSVQQPQETNKKVVQESNKKDSDSSYNYLDKSDSFNYLDKSDSFVKSSSSSSF